MRRPVRTSLALFRSRAYTLGILIASGSWAFHVGALALAPISLVQSVIAGGLVLLTVTADRLFAHKVTRREWIGVGLAALGLAFLAATLEGGADEAHSDYEAADLALWSARSRRRPSGSRRPPGSPRARRSALRRLGGPLLGGVGHLDQGASAATWATSRRWRSSPPLALVIALASFAGLVVSARSLQIGKAVPVIAVTSVAANVFTIAAGPIVFEEPLPDDTLGRRGADARLRARDRRRGAHPRPGPRRRGRRARARARALAPHEGRCSAIFNSGWTGQDGYAERG